MPKYAVSLGSLNETVFLEAQHPTQALSNTLATMARYAVVTIPQEAKKDTQWFARNTADAKDELVVSSPEEATKLALAVRKDVTSVFWFVSLDHESHKKDRKLK